jgi:hypothetical protein
MAPIRQSNVPQQETSAKARRSVPEAFFHRRKVSFPGKLPSGRAEPADMSKRFARSIPQDDGNGLQPIELSGIENDNGT